MLLAKVAEYKDFLNSSGIAFASIGTDFAMCYSTEVNFSDKETYLCGEGVITVPGPSPEDVKYVSNEILLD